MELITSPLGTIFDLTLKHVLGIKMRKVDGLSRRPDLKIGMENDNKNQKLIREKWIQSMMKVVVEGPEEAIKEKIKRARGKDK